MVRLLCLVIFTCFMSNACISNSQAKDSVQKKASLAEENLFILEQTQLSITPGDLTTNVGFMPPIIEVPAGLISPEQIVMLRNAISLVAWPEGNQIGGEIAHRPADLSKGIATNQFVFEPSLPLREEWLALRIDLTGLDGFRATGFQVQDRVWLARFHPSSAPTVTGVSLSPGDLEVGVAVGFSEPVRDARPAHDIVHVVQFGQSVECIQSVGDALQSRGGTRVIWLACQNVDIASPIEVWPSPDIQSTTGERSEVPTLASPRRWSEHMVRHIQARSDGSMILRGN